MRSLDEIEMVSTEFPPFPRALRTGPTPGGYERKPGKARLYTGEVRDCFVYALNRERFREWMRLRGDHTSEEEEDFHFQNTT